MSATIPLAVLADVYGFLGNSLLKPMTQTAAVGIDPTFWKSFPGFGDQSVGEAVAECARYAEQAAAQGEDAVERAAVEYTRLFVGPPSPAAAPWETLYRSADATVGFGEPTFEMKRILREAGLELQNENRQYEDHMGIELLYLSTRCAALAGSVGGAAAVGGDELDPSELLDFIDRHPLAWIGAFRARVAQAYPDGYFAALLGLAESVLAWHANVLRSRG
ncbi:TorD/DmsD family molecular chaperone [Raoultibacter phocaeensis]|uniref:TorD/DmsD family molecular chaperone n=1 Tax=Raoultibacter phocaeensis TaxID=2479841 RepID=UPI00111BB5F5|nr:molecular chaperone TorD family protein [Raoultibacter phocaeensis]